MALGMLIGYKIRDNFPITNFFSSQHAGLIGEISKLIEDRYMDGVSLDSLQRENIEVILSGLDPHSQYISPSEIDDINNSIEGQFFGIGVEYDIMRDSVYVLRIFKNSPAEKAGLISGDVILQAGSKNISRQSLHFDSVKNLLKGEKGSSITLTIFRNGNKKEVKLVRDKIAVNSIESSYRINDTTGYIRISNFSTQTHREFMEALQDLQTSPLKKLILDLRDNGGGVVDEAVEIADEFLDGDKLIAYTEGKHAPRNEYRCRRKGQFEEGKLIVLCNEESASASEILMGALQDWDRATIIGHQSFGKGLIQEQYDLSNGGAIRLSIARYYTPLGRSIQRSYKNGSVAYYDDGYKKIKPIDTLNVSRHFTTARGKKLYDKVGIKPDLLITSDTAVADSVFNLFIEKNIFSQEAFFFYLNHKDRMRQFTSPNQIHNFPGLTDSIDAVLSRAGIKNSINYSAILPANKFIVYRIMKSQIGGYNWGDRGYYEIHNNMDPIFIEAAKD